MQFQDYLLANHRFVIIILVLLLARLRHASSGNRFLIGFVNFFGTVLHELAHYLVGWLLLARPGRLSLWPRQTAHGFVLGSVSFGNLRFFNTLPTTLAPLLLLYV
ncbi:MAG: hypothetical protein HQL65_20550, partial [Magnetococcales bacterium]|nr:hypothetical protein [Magnetococcales bacterium]